jgi:serine/threonine protein kinase
VLDLPPGDRARILARASLDDPALGREVEALLDAAGQSGVTGKLAGALVGSASEAGAPVPAVSPYELVEQVSNGGMGIVYRARDPRLQRFVALKYLPASLGANPEIKRRFLQEAQTIAALDHPNLCTIFEVAEPAAGQLVIVMPYYEGETLRQKIARGPLPVTEALEYAGQVARGLAHAHEAGVVHRDIKPANVVVTPGRQVKILDFGIAKVADASAGLTRTGAVLGTVSYMSPEQASGSPVDHRTDLWSVGVVLYEMLAGRQPFTAESMEAVFLAIQSRPPTPLATLRPDVPPTVGALVHQLLEKDPAQRVADAQTLASTLDTLRVTAPTP